MQTLIIYMDWIFIQRSFVNKNLRIEWRDSELYFLRYILLIILFFFNYFIILTTLLYYYIVQFYKTTNKLSYLILNCTNCNLSTLTLVSLFTDNNNILLLINYFYLCQIEMKQALWKGTNRQEHWLHWCTNRGNKWFSWSSDWSPSTFHIIMSRTNTLYFPFYLFYYNVYVIGPGPV